MQTRVSLLLGLALVLSAGNALAIEYPARVTGTTPSFNENENRQLSLDTSGNLRVTLGGTGGGLGTATAAAPTRVEGSNYSFSFDLSGSARVNLTNLLSGEDTTRNLLMTGGALSGQTVIATAMVVGGDAAFKTAQPGWNGPKTFHGRLTGTGAITQVMKIYGGFNSSMTVTNSKEICRLTLSGTTETMDICPKPIEENFTYISVVTSGTTGTSASGELMMGIQ